MGVNCIDQYSLLHFSVGVIFYFFGVSFPVSVIGHIVFEYLENTKDGMKLINNIKIWPGGKRKADSLTNNITDTIFFSMGWIIANIIDKKFKLMYNN